jgi:MarR family transcriptional regulator for hemolysin
MLTPQERFVVALFNASRTWRLTLDRRLKHLGLGQSGWAAIAVVARAGMPLSQSELAQRVGVENATLVTTLDRLAAAGLIERQAVPGDRRVKQVVLTAAGEDMYAKVRVEAEALRTELLGDVSPALLQQTTELLETLFARGDALK